MSEWTVAEALAKRQHFIALGQTEIWLRGKDRPWKHVTRVDTGSGFRLSIPTSIKLVAEIDGLTFYWYEDFESSDANGHGVSLFDREKLREIIRVIPTKGRQQLRNLLAAEVLPAMTKRTDEIRAELNAQNDSEDCVRGMIALVEEDQ